jgi:hypothetical protein
MGGVTDVGEEWQYCRTRTRATDRRQEAGVPEAIGQASAWRPAQTARV